MNSSEQEHLENIKVGLFQEGKMSNVVVTNPVSKKSTSTVMEMESSLEDCTAVLQLVNSTTSTAVSQSEDSTDVIQSEDSIDVLLRVNSIDLMQSEDSTLVLESEDNTAVLQSEDSIAMFQFEDYTAVLQSEARTYAMQLKDSAAVLQLEDRTDRTDVLQLDYSPDVLQPKDSIDVLLRKDSNVVVTYPVYNNSITAAKEDVVDQHEQEIVIISDDDTSSGVGTSSLVINSLESKDNIDIKMKEDVIYINEDDNVIDEDVNTKVVHHNPIINQTDPFYEGDDNMFRLWNGEFSKNYLKPGDNRKLSCSKLPMKRVGNINTKSKVRPASKARFTDSDFRSSWVVTTWKVYRNKCKINTVARFWKKNFVQLVLSAIHANSLSPDQAAVILGVSVKELRLRLSATEPSIQLTQNIASSNYDSKPMSFNCGNDILKADKPMLTEDWLTPEVVDHLLRVTFMSKDRIILEDELSILRPSLNFYTDNFDRVCCEIEEAYSRHEILQNSRVLQELRAALVALDSYGLNSKSSSEVIALVPKYNFTRHMIEKPGSQYWDTNLPSLLLSDVRSKVLPVEVAAWQLGVSKQMVLCCLANTSKDRDQGDLVSVKTYMERGFGGREMFWKETSTLEMMGRVRNREMAVGEASAMLGVARSEVVVRCGGVKTQEEVDNEKKILELEKFKSHVEKMSYVRKETPLEKQIALAENQEGCLSDYEMMRLENMRERKSLLDQLDIYKDKRAIAEENKKMAIFTPKNCIKPREPSKRIRLINESRVVASKFDNYCLSSRISRMSPLWVGQWLPLKVTGYTSKHLADNIQKGKIHPRFYTPTYTMEKTFGDIYDLERLDQACHVPTVDMSLTEVMELRKDLQTSLATLDCLSAECKDVKYEPRYIESTGSPLTGLEQIQDSNIVSAPITCLDTYWDVIAHGSTMGQVGIQIETTVLTWRPHNRSVTRVLLSGGSHNLSLLSSSKDGTVRRTDLAKQLVLVEHYGTSGVSEMEKYGEKSFILNLGHEISVMDVRSRKVCKVLDLSETENTGDNSSLAVNPTNNNIVSVCLDSSVRIYDLRKSNHVVNFLPGSFCQSQWSPHSAKQFLTVNRENYIVDVYCSSDLSTPTFSKDINENQSPRGIFWNPWDESSLLLSDPSNAVSSLGKCVVTSVECGTGQETDRLEVEVGSHPYLLHSHGTRPVLVVGNNRRPGGLAIYSK